MRKHKKVFLELKNEVLSLEKLVSKKDLNLDEITLKLYNITSLTFKIAYILKLNLAEKFFDDMSTLFKL